MGDLRDALIDSGSSAHKKQLWQYLMDAKRKYRPITDEECAVCSFRRYEKSLLHSKGAMMSATEAETSVALYESTSTIGAEVHDEPDEEVRLRNSSLW